ncbi:MAG: P27 family phage terminase small subunit [Sphingomonadales bacterium]|nr:P27 family phage terminase small subunit [Sphingomonadales bacterium]
MAPHHLTADAVEEWNRVATELYNLGILSEVDRAALAAYARPMAAGSRPNARSRRWLRRIS